MYPLALSFVLALELVLCGVGRGAPSPEMLSTAAVVASELLAVAVSWVSSLATLAAEVRGVGWAAIRATGTGAVHGEEGPSGGSDEASALSLPLPVPLKRERRGGLLA